MAKILKALLHVSYLEKSFASVQKDFVEKFYILLFHEFVGVDPGALVQPQVNQVHWVTDALWQGKKDSLHSKIHGKKYRVIYIHTYTQCLVLNIKTLVSQRQIGGSEFKRLHK